MKTRRSLRVPLILTWTAVSGAAVVASVSCSSGSESPSSEDASSKDGAPVGDAKRNDRLAMEASATDASDGRNLDVAAPFECEKITDSAILFLDADGPNCPDGDMKIPIV